MRGLFSALCAAFLVAGCSSNGGGTSNGTGSIGVNAGATGITITARLSTESFNHDTHLSICSVSVGEGLTFVEFDSDGNVLASNDSTGDVAIATGAQVEFETGLTTATGELTISLTDTGPVTSPNKVFNFTRYTVSYTAGTAGAPALPSRTYAISIPVTLIGAAESTFTTTVLLVDLDSTRAAFEAANPSGTIFTYSIRVNITGTRIDTGEVVNISAIVNLAMGNFDRC